MKNIIGITSQILHIALVALAFAALPTAACSSTSSVGALGDGGKTDGYPGPGDDTAPGDSAPGDSAPGDSASSDSDAMASSDRAQASDATPPTDQTVEISDAAVMPRPDAASDRAAPDAIALPDTFAFADAASDHPSVDGTPAIDGPKDGGGEVRSPLTCEEIYICSQACGRPGDSRSVECVNTCLAAGCAGAQSPFRNLEGCRGTICGYICGAGRSSPGCLDCVTSRCPILLKGCIEAGC